MNADTVFSRICLIVCFLTGSTLYMNAQVRDTCTFYYNFIDSSSDIFHYEGKKYLMEKSPLDFFEGYRELYNEIPKFLVETMPGGGSVDKNYAAGWIIRDGELYLSNINFKDCVGVLPDGVEKLYPDNEVFKRMERLTQRKFEKYTYSKGFNYIPNPYGFLKASWFTGTLFVKRPLDSDRQETLAHWQAEPSLRLIFQEGKLISITKVPALLYTGVIYIPKTPKSKGEYYRIEYEKGHVISRTTTKKGKAKFPPKYQKFTKEEELYYDLYKTL